MEHEPQTPVLAKIPNVNPAVVTLGASVADLVEHYKQYEEVKTKLLVPTDYVIIAGKKAIAKPGWMKLGVAFNLSTKIIRQVRYEKDGLIRWEIDIECLAPNGRTVEECGLCDNMEERQIGSPDHKLKSMAVTRATERAYIKMLGAPDTAADDMPDDLSREPYQPNNPPNLEVCHCSWNEMSNNKGKCGHCGKPLTVGQIQALEKRK